VSAEQARALLAELIGEPLAAGLDARADLVAAGVNSGDVVRLALLVEQRFGADLSTEDLEGLRSLDAVESLLDRLGRRDGHR